MGDPAPPTARDTPFAPQQAMFGIGDKIAGRYVVKAVLGAGGMGTVYRAIDEELDETVALKVLKGGAAENQFLRDEVRLAQKVTHPNVCRTFDLETTEGCQFIKMELVAGEPLSERLERDKRLPVVEAIRIARAVADGLAAMHAQQIVHRDLKPGNVMLGRDGRVVLMDFGLAHKLETGDVGIAGTPGYMAPEQLLGEDIDHRTDYYALGCLLYEMLAGERVYGKGTMLEIADRHVEAPVPDVRERRPDTPRWLARTTTALLSKERAERELGMAMLAPKSRRALVLPLVVAIVAVVAISVVWVVRGQKPWRPDIVDLPQFEESSDGASISPDGTLIAYNSDRLDPEKRFRIYVADLDGSNEHPITPFGASYGEARWTRDGKHLLAEYDSLDRLSLDSTPPVPVGSGSSPDDCGDAIVFVTPSFDGWRLMIQEAGKPPRELVHAYADEWLERPRCDRSGQRIVFLRGMSPATAFSSDVFVIDRKGQITQLTDDHAAGPATWTPDDTIVFSRRNEGRVQLFEMPATGGAATQRTFDDGPDSVPDVSADGDTLVFGREVNLFTITGGTRGNDEKRTLSSRREVAYNLRAATPDGSVLLATRAKGSGDDILVIDTLHGTASDRVLTSGYLPFPSLDGKTVYFRAVEDPGTLMAIPLAGGTPRQVAKFPGRIIVGVDGPRGQQVMIDHDHEFESWHVRGEDVRQDGVEGLLVPAPSGAYRYVQRPGDYFELRIIGPDASLASRDCVHKAESLVNPWLDEFHVAFESPDDDAKDRNDHWRVLDVRTCTETDHFKVPSRGGYYALLAPDGTHWFSSEVTSRGTRHVARGFAKRPR